MSSDVPFTEVDPRLRPAVLALNRLPGVATRASCQGKTLADAGTHADLAYVLFEEPIPLTLEDRLLAELGEIARVDPDGIHCRWPERNEELCARLEDAANGRARDLAGERWECATVAVAEAERAIAARILGEGTGDLGWCLDCREIAIVASHELHRWRLLLRAGEERTRAAFAAYLADDPPDARLLEREGADAVLERLRHGDFGESYRDRWRRFVSAAAARVLRDEMRAAVRDLRSAEWTTDSYFRSSSFVLCARALA